MTSNNPKFTYCNNVFQALRNLTTTESGLQNREKRTRGFTDRVVLEGYDYNEFYEAAKAVSVATDLYVMNDETIVIPHSNGLLIYDASVPLQTKGLTYFTRCCGKIVDSRRTDRAMGYTLIGKVEGSGDNYCPRCKRDVTRTGNIKKSPKNTDIDQNGSWDYKLVKLGDELN